MNISIDKIREIFGNMLVENLVLHSRIEALEKENEQLKEALAKEVNARVLANGGELEHSTAQDHRG